MGFPCSTGPSAFGLYGPPGPPPTFSADLGSGEQRYGVPLFHSVFGSGKLAEADYRAA